MGDFLRRIRGCWALQSQGMVSLSGCRDQARASDLRIE
jgi:hypothetical protein